MTKNKKFLQKVKEIIPQHLESMAKIAELDSYDYIENEVFRDNEYLGGMAVVIIALLKQEEKHAA